MNTQVHFVRPLVQLADGEFEALETMPAALFGFSAEEHADMANGTPAERTNDDGQLVLYFDDAELVAFEEKARKVAAQRST